MVFNRASSLSQVPFYILVSSDSAGGALIFKFTVNTLTRTVSVTRLQ
jgi:hypothetical protein